jgi:hypothetical protein
VERQLPGALNGLLLAVAFLSEVAALVVLALWGWSTGSGAGGWLLAVGLPLVAAVLWGLYAAPRARFRVRAPAAAVKVLVLGGAAVALADLGHPRAAAVLALAALLGTTLPTQPGVSSRPAR